MRESNVYVDLDGDAIPLGDLDGEERRMLARLRRRARTHPDWDDFDNYWTAAVPAFYVARGLPRKSVPQTVLWRIAQDLSSRLGIAAGHIQPPGPFDDLDKLVLSEFGSVRAFCEATGIPERALDGFMAGRGDLSLATLLQGLVKIGYRLRLAPAAPPAGQGGSRRKRTARSA